MFLLLSLILNIVGSLAQAPGVRIVGGHPVSITERPFQVSLFRKIPVLASGCGGTIIHRRWILTAAHCVFEVPPEDMAIRAGSDTMSDDEGAEWYDVVESIPNEHYDSTSWAMTHDIALLMVDRNIEFSPTIQPIRLRTQSPRPSLEAVVSGFGNTFANRMAMSNILKEVSVTVLDRQYCKQLLARITKSQGLSKTHFCAAYLDGKRDACQGDSGGPITIGKSLAGVVSWGIGCAQKMVPAFYTDVAQFVPWISQTIGKYSTRSRTCKAG